MFLNAFSLCLQIGNGRAKNFILIRKRSYVNAHTYVRVDEKKVQTLYFSLYFRENGAWRLPSSDKMSLIFFVSAQDIYLDT